MLKSLLTFKTFALNLCICLFISQNCYSQEPIYEHFGVDEGLPSSQIYDVYQSKDGNIWFASDRGLAAYNGYEFKKYGVKEGIPSSVVLDFFPQTNGQIWCATLHTNKLFFFNERFKEFTTYEFNALLSETLPPSAVIESVYLDKDNSLHIGCSKMNGEIVIDDEGLLVKRGKELNDCDKLYKVVHADVDNRTFSFLTEELKPLKDEEIRRENESNLLRKSIYSTGNILSINGSSIEILNIEDRTDKKINTGYPIIGVNSIDANRFLVGYDYYGAQIMDMEGNVLNSFLEGKAVTSFLMDQEGGYWLTTLNSGVFYIKNPNIFTKKIDKTLGKTVMALAKGYDDKLYVSYQNGDLVCLDDEKSNLLNDKTLSIKGVVPFVEYNSNRGELFVHMDNVLTRYSKNDEREEEVHYTLKFSEPQDDIVFASTNGYTRKISLKETKKILVGERCLDACLFGGKTYIATSKGLFKTVSDSVISLASKNKLLSYRIEDIDINFNEDAMYMATIGAGIVVYREEGISNIDASDGLYSNTVNEVYFEDDHTLWVCTDSGINKVALFGDNTYEISGLNKNDGLLSNEVEDVEIIKDTVWVGTKNGLCYFPKKILEDNALPELFLKLKHVKVNDSTRDLNTSLKLNYEENKLSFFVEGVSFNKKLIYKYKIEGLNNNWQYSRNREITFSALASGNYTFKAMACLDMTGDCYEEMIDYSFSISPPFWKRWWFYSICVLGTCVLIYMFFKYRILSYNKDITRELIRLIVKRIKKKEKYLVFKEAGKDIRIKTDEILYVRSSGNYIDIITEKQNHTVRCKISEFIALTPDSLEYIRIHRSFIIRLDKVKSKSKSEVSIGDETLPVSAKYVTELEKIHF